MRFQQLQWARIHAGADGLPSHIFPNCPTLGRLRRKDGRAAYYKLGPNANVLSLIKCHWCRSEFLRFQVENPEMPQEIVDALDRERREDWPDGLPPMFQQQGTSGGER